MDKDDRDVSKKKKPPKNAIKKFGNLKDVVCSINSTDSISNDLTDNRELIELDVMEKMFNRKRVNVDEEFTDKNDSISPNKKIKPKNSNDIGNVTPLCYNNMNIDINKDFNITYDVNDTHPEILDWTTANKWRMILLKIYDQDHPGVQIIEKLGKNNIRDMDHETISILYGFVMDALLEFETLTKNKNVDQNDDMPGGSGNENLLTYGISKEEDEELESIYEKSVCDKLKRIKEEIYYNIEEMDQKNISIVQMIVKNMKLKELNKMDTEKKEYHKKDKIAGHLEEEKIYMRNGTNATYEEHISDDKDDDMESTTSSQDFADDYEIDNINTNRHKEDFGMIILISACTDPLLYEYGLHTYRKHFSLVSKPGFGHLTGNMIWRKRVIKRRALIKEEARKLYKTIDNATVHDIDSIKQFSIDLFKCSECSYKSSSLSNLTVHIRSHTTKEDFKYKCITRRMKDYIYCSIEEMDEETISVLNKHIRNIYIRSGPKINYEKDDMSKTIYEEYTPDDKDDDMESTTSSQDFADDYEIDNINTNRHWFVYGLVNNTQWNIAKTKKEKLKSIIYIGITLNLCARFYDHKKDCATVHEIQSIKQFSIDLFKCSRCSFKSGYSSSLINHMRCHTDEKPYKCVICSYKGRTQSNLNYHMLTHTKEKPHKCSYCDYETGQSSILKRHIRTHTNEKPFKCSYCQYATGDSSGLKSHMITHSDEKPYKCSYCEYTSKRPQTLKRHIRTHTNEKPFKCSYCQYAAADSPTLKRHIRTHTDEKPYKCSYCEYAAADSSTLKVHIRTHTDEKPYKCSVCSFESGNSSNLNVHMKSSHKRL